jgi:hypothetical protein
MSTLSRVLLSLCFPLLLLPGQLWALAFEATGTAPWDARQPTLSRERALQQAVRQIRQKASDYMRLRRQNEQTRGGLGGYDALEAYQAGAVDNVRVVEEQIKGGQLLLTVIGDIELYRDCQGGRADPPHRLTLALTHFPLQRPEQANTGYLHDIQNRFSNFLAYELRRSSALFNAIDLDRVNLVDDPTQAPARLLPEGRVTTALQQAEQFNVQYLISGVIRSMALQHPVQPREPNLFVDLYDRAGFGGQDSNRYFELDLFIHDAFTGVLVAQKRYQMQGKWELDPHIRTGFDSPPFWQQEYGQKMRALIRTISNDIQLQLGCEPLRARITRSRDDLLWIDAGSDSGLQPGDKLRVYRRVTRYDRENRPYFELEATGVELTLEQVQATLARGHLPADSGNLNIQRDDIVIAQ